MATNRRNGTAKLELSPNGASMLTGVLTLTLLHGVRTEDELEDLIARLSTAWSIAQESHPGQAIPLSAIDAQAIQILLNALVEHLRGSFGLLSDSS